MGNSVQTPPSQFERHTGPAVLSALVFASGIIAGSKYSLNWPIPVTGALLGIVLCFFFRKHTTSASVCASASLFFAGMMGISVSGQIHQPVIFQDERVNGTVTVTGMIVGSPKIYNPAAARITIDIITIDPSGGISNAQGTIPVYVYRQLDTELDEGATVHLRGTIKRYHSTGNSPYTHRIVVGNGSDNFATIIQPSSNPFVKIRTLLSHNLNRYDFHGNREIVRAITIGDRARLTYDTSAAFARAGIAHVLAVSGLHAAIVTMAVLFIIGFLVPNRTIRNLIVIPVLLLYAGICGFRPPVVRASLLIGAIHLAPLFGRQVSRENILAVILIIILAIDPRALFGPSLQLSFAAVWGLITFYDPIMQRIPHAPGRRHLRALLSPVVASLVATISTAPVIAVHFGELPVLSLITNVPAIMVMMMVVPLGWIALLAPFFGNICDPVGTVAATIAGYLVTGLHDAVQYVSAMHFATVDISIPGIAAILMGISAFLLSRHMLDDTFRKAALWPILSALVIIVWSPVVHAYQNAGKAVFFDVGQGDAILVTYANGRTFLIDSGPSFGSFDSASTTILPYLSNAGIHRLDGLFISHCHADHTGGIQSVISGIPVNHIYTRADISDSLGNVFGRAVVGLSAGDSLAFDGGGMLIVSPVKELNSDENNLSLVMRADIGSTRVLLTGDIEDGIQNQLLQWDSRLTADILKAPHHGGNLTEQFFALIDPSATIISCGYGNHYGHPTTPVLDVLSKHPTSVYRTDQHGTITIDIPSFSVTLE